jgi:hypothetical protein
MESNAKPKQPVSRIEQFDISAKTGGDVRLPMFYKDPKSQKTIYMNPAGTVFITDKPTDKPNFEPMIFSFGSGSQPFFIDMGLVEYAAEFNNSIAKKDGPSTGAISSLPENARNEWEKWNAFIGHPSIDFVSMPGLQQPKPHATHIATNQTMEKRNKAIDIRRKAQAIFKASTMKPSEIVRLVFSSGTNLSQLKKMNESELFLHLFDEGFGIYSKSPIKFFEDLSDPELDQRTVAGMCHYLDLIKKDGDGWYIIEGKPVSKDISGIVLYWRDNPEHYEAMKAQVGNNISKIPTLSESWGDDKELEALKVEKEFSLENTLSAKFANHTKMHNEAWQKALKEGFIDKEELENPALLIDKIKTLSMKVNMAESGTKKK